jgi:polyisoprenoid-binding protein YceI
MLKINLKKNLIILSLLITPIFTAATIGLSIDPANSKIKFQATGKPSLMKIKGDGAQITGKFSIDENKLTGIFKVKLSEFDTGISLRNEHMKEKYLEVSKYPEAKLEISVVDLPNNWNTRDSIELPFNGKLTLKETTKEITGTATINGEKLQANVIFDFKLSDFNLGIPSYMGITVADLVRVSTEVTAQNQSKP